MKIINLETTESTNSTARRLLSEEKYNLPFCLKAQKQTAGKGRGTNSWHSQAGKNITCSFAAAPKLPATRQFLLSKAVSLAVCNFLDNYADNFQVKWPNDIYHFGKKIGGILIENTLSGAHIKYSIIGIGININQSNFPEKLPNPVSLSQITGKNYALEALTENLAETVVEACQTEFINKDDTIDKHYLSKLYRYGRKSRYRDKNGVFSGTITGIDSYGHLQVWDADAGLQKKYDFKEVVFL